MKAVIFDLYNTLVEVKTDEHCEKAWAPVVEFFAKHGMKTDWKKLCFEFDRYWKLFSDRAAAERKFLFPECDCVTQFESIARSVGGKLSREDAATALRLMRRGSTEILRIFDGTFELLKELRSLGAKLYILSNAQAAFTRDELKEVGLIDKFDGILLSSEHGCRKPDPAFFEILFDTFDLNRSESVMVGDDMQSDVGGANRFGIQSIWVGGGAAAHAKEIIDWVRA